MSVKSIFVLFVIVAVLEIVISSLVGIYSGSWLIFLIVGLSFALFDVVALLFEESFVNTFNNNKLIKELQLLVGEQNAIKNKIGALVDEGKSLKATIEKAVRKQT